MVKKRQPRAIIRQVNRSAIDGQFVSDEYANDNPKTTIRQTLRIFVRKLFRRKED